MLLGFLVFLSLLGTLCIATVSLSASRLGETRTLPIIKRKAYGFFSYPLHRIVGRSHPFETFLFATRLGENLARVGYACCALLLVFSLQLGLAYSLGLGLALLLLLLLLGDLLPRVLSLRMPERALTLCSPLTSLFLLLFFPLTFLFLKLAGVTAAALREEEGFDPIEEMREKIVQILQNANVKGTLAPADEKLIDSVVKFKDRIVREVMVPRVDLFSLPVTTSIREAAPLLVEEGYSRTPVYRDSVDNIVGVLMFKDILELYMDCEVGKREENLLDASIETIVKSVFYTPETKKVSHLLQEFRTKQMHMAIVVDEYGGTEGVVTIEDILEEIVGEIADEYDLDEETLYVTQPGGGSWIVDARMSIFDAEDTFGIHIPQEGEYDTIGGYIFHKVGAIPEKGLKIHHEDFDLEILRSTDRSVEKVRITPRRNRQ